MGGIVKRETLKTESLGGMMPICPSCGHHNAMLGPSRNDETGKWEVYDCRDCGYKCAAVEVVEVA